MRVPFLLLFTVAVLSSSSIIAQDKPEDSKTISQDKLGDLRWHLLNPLKNFTTLTIDYTEITDAGLIALSELTSLTSLELNGFRNSLVTEVGLKELSKLKNLRSLSINGCAERKRGHSIFNDYPL